MGALDASFCFDCGWTGERADLAVGGAGLRCPNCGELILFVEDRRTGERVSLEASYGWDGETIRRWLIDTVLWQVPLDPYTDQVGRSVRRFGPGARDTVAGRELLYRQVAVVPAGADGDPPDPTYERPYVEGWIVDEADGVVLLEGVGVDEVDEVHRAVFDGEPERFEFNSIAGVGTMFPIRGE